MKWFLLSALIWVATIEVVAQQTYAVVVGVSDYVGTRNDLHFADDDAWLVTRFLRSPKGGSIPPNHIITLTNGQATHANVLQALRIFEMARPSDRILFHFSGHGLDGTFFTADDQELLHQELKAAFRRSAAKTKIVWADACHSGSIRQSSSVRPINSQKNYSQFNDPSLNIIVMASSRSSQNSMEQPFLGQGAFTYFLVKGAQGDADQNHDGIVTIAEHYQYVRDRVQQVTHNAQIPIITGKFSNTLPITIL
ncbi:caspase family protein [Spirosoma endbachense]|uniref:Caspase family protein n=1 Tax=Spirosoma endbachense TaxID=2666025 RepID=A0A6P1WAT7_9BACT|nr:caspase family protein [Spirosoma endbachense]QHW00877.1 caspase family protein [Spirosoma endbachense]